MSRAELLEQYKVNDDGVIQTPGKFEGERIYAPYLWDCYLDGLHDSTESDGTIVFVIGEADFDEFPELADIEYVYMTEDENGFVSLRAEKVKESVGF